MRSLTSVVPAIFITSFTTTSFSFDVNGHDREGLPEAVHSLQVYFWNDTCVQHCVTN